MVTITGSDQQQYKAQCFIFHKIAEQTEQYFDDVSPVFVIRLVS